MAPMRSAECNFTSFSESPSLLIRCRSHLSQKKKKELQRQSGTAPLGSLSTFFFFLNLRALESCSPKKMVAEQHDLKLHDLTTVEETLDRTLFNLRKTFGAAGC